MARKAELAKQKRLTGKPASPISRRMPLKSEENEKVKKDSASHNQLFRAITPNLYDRIATDM